MVTPDEQRALQLENAEADERLFSVLHDMAQEQADDHKGLMASAERAIADNQASAADAADKVAAAKKRAERIKRGDDVQGGLGKPENFEQMLIKAGWTNSDIQHCSDVAELAALGSWDKTMQEMHKVQERAWRALVRKLLRQMRT